MCLWWMLVGLHPFHKARGRDGDRGLQVDLLRRGDKAANIKSTKEMHKLEKWWGASHSFTLNDISMHPSRSQHHMLLPADVQNIHQLYDQVVDHQNFLAMKNLPPWSNSRLLPESQCAHITCSKTIEASWAPDFCLTSTTTTSWTSPHESSRWHAASRASVWLVSE